MNARHPYLQSYKRVLVKLSGESLGSKTQTFDAAQIDKTLKLIQKTHQKGVQIAILCGGGNLARGKDIHQIGLSQANADSVGMLATIMNSLVLFERLKNLKLPVKMLSSLRAEGVCESFNHKQAEAYLEAGNILLLAGGTGKPFFTTDTAAVILALECQCDAIFKLTKVDGVYSKDPKETDALFYPTLSISEAIKENLKVMDSTAFTLCQEHKIPIHICNMNNENAVIENLASQKSGSLVFPSNNQ